MAQGRGIIRVVLAAAVLALLVAAVSGCGGSGSIVPPKSTGTSPSGETVSLKTDETKSETKAISATEGATFATSSAEGTAAVIIMPGTFPNGTRVTFTPLADTGEQGALPGFDIAAEGDLQPSLPVFVVFETTAELPKDQTIVAYGDASDAGVPLNVTRSSDASSNYLLAEVAHFTVFRVDRGNPAGSTPQDKNDQYQSGFKQWAVKVNDTVKADDGMWLGALVFKMDVQSPAGDIMGPYNGQASYKVDLDMNSDVGALAGRARGAWAGPANFSACSVKKYHFSDAPTKGKIKPGLGFWLFAEGDFRAKEIAPFEVSLQGLEGAGTADLSPFAPGEVPLTLFISESGATVELAGHQFKGFVIGTLAEEPSN